MQLREEELSEERVVAIPLPPAIERNKEQVRGLQRAQLRMRIGDLQDIVAERRGELVEHRGAPQELLGAFWQLLHDHAVEVVGDVPIVTGDRVGVLWVLLGDQGSEVEPDGPSLGAFDHRGGQLGSELDVGLREDVLGGRRVERQVTRSELERVARRPKPRQVRLLGTTGRDHL